MINFEYQSAIVGVGVNLFLTVYVLFKNRGWSGNLNRTFAFLTLTFACWNAGIVFQSIVLLLTGLMLSAPATFGFFTVLIRKRSRQEQWVIAFIWILTVAFLLSFLNFRQPVWLYQIYATLILGFVALWGMKCLYLQIRLTKSRKERVRLWVVLTGIGAACGGGLTSWLVALGVHVPSISIIGGLFFTISITVAIMRHRLIDFGALTARAIIIFILTFTFWILIGILGNWHRETPYTSVLSILVATLVLIALYEPLTSLVEGQTSRVLSRESREFYQNLVHFSRMMNNFVSEPTLVKSLGMTFRQSNRIGNFSIFLTDPHEDHLVCRDSQGLRWQQGDLMMRNKITDEYLAHRQNLILKYSLAREIQTGLAMVLRRRRIELYRFMGRFKADICVPFTAADQFYGFVTLGLHDPEGELMIREEETIISVMHQFAIALAHARVVEREKTKDQLAAIGELASGLAHEIRNPLATINAATQYLQPGCSDPQTSEFFKIIRDEVERLNRFVSRFLAYAKPVTARHELDLDSPAAIIRKLELALKELIAQQSCKLETHIDDEIAAFSVPVDPWSQIIGNLAENACSAAGWNGRVRISIQKAQPPFHYELIVEDSGPGISEDQVNLIFRPFYTTREKGTGLGLAIVHQMVQNMNGSITVGRSALGGALFDVKLPPTK